METPWENYHPCTTHGVIFDLTDEELYLEKLKTELQKAEKHIAQYPDGAPSELIIIKYHLLWRIDESRVRISQLKAYAQSLELHLDGEGPYRYFQEDLTINYKMQNEFLALRRQKVGQALENEIFSGNPNLIKDFIRNMHSFTDPEREDILDSIRGAVDEIQAPHHGRLPQVTKDGYQNRHPGPDQGPERTKIRKLVANPLPVNVRFTYADGLDIVRNAEIIYWLYETKNIQDNDPKSLEDYTIYQKIHNKRKIMYPVGIARTDNMGYLCQGVANLKPYGSRIHAAQNTVETGFHSQTTFQKEYQAALARWALLCDQMEGKAEKTNTLGRREKFQLTHNYLNPNHVHGFLCYPMDCGRFKTKDLLELTRLKPPGGKDAVAYKGRLPYWDPFPETIKVHCTLPQWNLRLRERLDELLVVQKAYELAKAPHLEKLHLVERMQELVELNLKFPYEKVSLEMIQSKMDLLAALYELEQGIDTHIHQPSKSHGPRSLRPYYDAVEKQAVGLWELMQQPALINELKWYMEQISDREPVEDPKRLQLPPGPYMDKEEGWVEIFDTLARALAALSVTSLAKEVWETDIKAGIEDLANDKNLLPFLKPSGGTDENIDKYKDNLLRSQINRFTFDTSESPNPGLLSIVIKGYSNFLEKYQEWRPALELVTSTPGPPCLLQVVLDCYGNYINRHVMRYGPAQSGQHIKAMIGVMRIFSFFRKDADYQNKVNNLFACLTRKNGQPNLAQGRMTLAEVFIPTKTDASEYVYGASRETAAKFYKTAFVMLNVSVFVQTLVNQPPDADGRVGLRDVLKAVETLGSGAVLGSVMIITGNRYAGFARRSVRKLLIDLLKEGTDELAVLVGLISATIAICDMVEHFGQGKIDQSIMDGVRGLGWGTQSAGWFLKHRADQIAKSRVGFLIRRVFIRLAARMAAQGAALAGSAAIPVVGQALLVVGTVVNVGMLILDLIPIIWENIYLPNMRKTHFGDSYLLFHSYWEAFTKAQDPRTTQVENKDLHDFNPYLTYTLGWENSLTRGPIERINTLRRAEKHMEKFGLDKGVHWVYFNWRVVVPLYVSGYSSEQIEKVVYLPDYLPKSKIHTVGQIIQYYEEVNALGQVEKKPLSDRFLKHSIVAQLLREGNFNPKKGLAFHRHDQWAHKHFWTSIGPTGFDDLRNPFTRSEAVEIRKHILGF